MLPYTSNYRFFFLPSIVSKKHFQSQLRKYVQMVLVTIKKQFVTFLIKSNAFGKTTRKTICSLFNGKITVRDISIEQILLFFYWFRASNGEIITDNDEGKSIELKWPLRKLAFTHNTYWSFHGIEFQQFWEIFCEINYYLQFSTIPKIQVIFTYLILRVRNFESTYTKLKSFSGKSI